MAAMYTLSVERVRPLSRSSCKNRMADTSQKDGSSFRTAHQLEKTVSRRLVDGALASAVVLATIAISHRGTTHVRSTTRVGEAKGTVSPEREGLSSADLATELSMTAVSSQETTTETTKRTEHLVSTIRLMT